MNIIAPQPTIHDGIRLSGAAYRLLTGNPGPHDLDTLNQYRRGNDRDIANAARLFLDMFSGGVMGDADNVVSLAAHQTRHDLAHAFRSMDAASYDPLHDGKEPA